MIIVGVDPGLASTGYGVIEVNGSRYRHICHGVIKTEPGLPLGERLLLLKTALDRVVVDHAPMEAAVESLYFGRNVGSAIPVSHARGVVLCTLAERAVPCFEYNPRAVKQAVVGTGSAEKTQIQEMIRIIFRLSEPPRADHAADALAVAFCHSNQSNFGRLVRESTGVQ